MSLRHCVRFFLTRRDQRPLRRIPTAPPQKMRYARFRTEFVLPCTEGADHGSPRPIFVLRPLRTTPIRRMMKRCCDLAAAMQDQLDGSHPSAVGSSPAGCRTPSRPGRPEGTTGPSAFRVRLLARSPRRRGGLRGWRHHGNSWDSRLSLRYPAVATPEGSETNVRCPCTR